MPMKGIIQTSTVAKDGVPTPALHCVVALSQCQDCDQSTSWTFCLSNSIVDSVTTGAEVAIQLNVMACRRWRC